jgi:tetraacyldisaccharide 4'-kinase
MTNLRAKIADYLNRDCSHKDNWLDRLLGLFAHGYGGIASTRARLYRDGVFTTKHIPCPVISVGNLTVGGTGKTPMTHYLATLLQTQGNRVAIITRGYRGQKERGGGIVSDGKKILLGCQQAGDEALMLAQKLPGVVVAVGQDRYASAQKVLKAYRPDVMLLDDGFQHLRLARQINLLLMDYHRPLGNGFILPRGPLRESVNALQRADAICFTRTDQLRSSVPAIDERLNVALTRLAKAPPLFYFGQKTKVTKIASPTATKTPRHFSGGDDLRSGVLIGKKIFAFSGIGNNQAFRQTIADLGGNIVGYRDFGDHHRYRPHEPQELVDEALKRQADYLATTEKDVVRLPEAPWGPFAVLVIGIKMTLYDRSDTGFCDFITQKLKSTVFVERH